MALDAQQRRALRSLQMCLDSSLPGQLLDGVGRNDIEAWSALTMLEVRMLVARGQTYQARQFGARLSTAAAAGLAVEPFEGKEYPLLINGIDAVQASRHYLARVQLSKLTESTTPTIRWAANLWLGRGLVGVGELEQAQECSHRALQIAGDLPEDARQWSICTDAELQARAGEQGEAEARILRVLSYFIGKGDPRGESAAYLSLAVANALAGNAEDSDAAAELAYNTDGSWTGPALRLAVRALQKADLDRARQLLASIPSPTTDAFLLRQTLAAARPRQITLDAILRHLELQEAAPTPVVVADLRRLLEDCPRFVQARETLFWKLLYRGEIEQAEKQALAMVDDAADGTSIVAVRFGLQTFREQTAAEDSRVEELPSADGRPPEAPRSRPTGPIQPARLARARKMTGTFTGQLSLFGVPDLLQFLCNARRTGVLTFSSQKGDAKIRMHDGSLYWGTSPAHPSIVDFLLQRQAVPESAAEAGRGLDLDAVTVLARAEGVDQEKLATTLRESLHMTVKEAVDWSDGWFMFDRVPDAEAPPPELLFSVQGILLDALRELDEERAGRA